jgi:hypothetical protein
VSLLLNQGITIEKIYHFGSYSVFRHYYPFIHSSRLVEDLPGIIGALDLVVALCDLMMGTEIPFDQTVSDHFLYRTAMLFFYLQHYPDDGNVEYGGSMYFYRCDKDTILSLLSGKLPRFYLRDTNDDSGIRCMRLTLGEYDRDSRSQVLQEDRGEAIVYDTIEAARAAVPSVEMDKASAVVYWNCSPVPDDLAFDVVNDFTQYEDKHTKRYEFSYSCVRLNGRVEIIDTRLRSLYMTFARVSKLIIKRDEVHTYSGNQMWERFESFELTRRERVMLRVIRLSQYGFGFGVVRYSPRLTYTSIFDRLDEICCTLFESFGAIRCPLEARPLRNSDRLFFSRSDGRQLPLSHSGSDCQWLFA